jgi:cysteine-rich repeat protein
LAAAIALHLIAGPSEDAAARVQTPDQRKCIVELNKRLRNVAKSQGKENSRCVKDGGWRNTRMLGPSGTIEGCLTADQNFRVAAAKRKTIERGAVRCEPPLPEFAASDPNTLNEAAVEHELGLIHDIFNDDLDGRLVRRDLTDPESPSSVTAQCQSELAKKVQKCLETQLKEFRRCKELGLNHRTKPGQLYPGADTPFNDAGDVQGCMGFDRKFKIGRHCGTKLAGNVQAWCGSVDLGLAFPGACFDAVDLATCLGRLAECRFCLMVNQADALTQDCDLFDDDAANDSCPPALPSCGDGVVQTLIGEECEDGNTQSDDGCSELCRNEVCGDGIVQPTLGEQCDDGNALDGACCSSSCQIESAGTVCRWPAGQCDIEETCNGIDPECPVDGLVLDGTTCDDGDSCTSNDRCQGGACRGVFIGCGNGMLEGTCGETCDDGNTDNCDGCSDVCQIEVVPIVCGDGAVNRACGEECDLGWPCGLFEFCAASCLCVPLF